MTAHDARRDGILTIALNNLADNAEDGTPLTLSAAEVAVLREAAAALAVRPAPEWEPISTAPKDGTRIVGYCPTQADRHAPFPTCERVIFFGRGQWLSLPGWWSSRPTHWLKLPPLDADAARKEEG